jgi:cell division ATPase MinD/MIP family channel proteins
MLSNMAETDLIKRCIAELVGTALLVFVGCGIVVTALLLLQGVATPAGNTYNLGIDITTWLVLSLGFGLSIMILVYVFGNVSGTHINPAISIALWATKRLPTKDMLAYVVAQFIGATIGALAIVAVWGTRAVTVGGLGATTMFPGVTYWQAILAETICTFILMIAVMATAVDKRSPAGWAGLVIGTAATISVLLGGNVTGGSLNPARTFGPYLVDTLMGGSNFWWQFPIYFIGPVLAAPTPQINPEPRPAPGPLEKAGTVICVGAGKGGTGKTTFSINLGIALAEMGFDTVLLDADTSMSNMASYMGIDVQSMKATLHEVLSGEAEPDKAVYRAFNDRLRIVPSGLSIAGFLKMDRSLLDDVIGHFSRNADFIVIDTPAGYNKEVALSLYAADYLILVLNPDEGSMIDGLKVQEMARILDVRVPGIVLNRYDMKGHQYSRSQIEQYFGTPVIGMIPEDGELRRKDKVPAILANPGSRAAREIYRVAEAISGRKRSEQPAARPFATRLMEALFKS